MGKLIQLLLQYVVLPLVTKGIEWLWKYFENSREDDKRNDKIDQAVDRLKNAPTTQEKKDALKDLVRGVGALDGV